MSATDELRRLLDEREVEWLAVKWNPKKVTEFKANGIEWHYLESDEYDDCCSSFCWLVADVVGPEQAIAATLGYGECQADETETIECVCDDVWHYGKRLTVHVMECSECGRTYEHVNGTYEFCPHCGRRVVDE